MASMTNINSFMKDNNQQYASNDSGLSVNSNEIGDNCQRNINSQDFVCDDLTKSLFINSLCGNDLIQDDDIYSYKSKMEIASIFQNKFRSFNLAKTDNFNFKNPCSFTSIIHDIENLKVSESRPRSNNTSWKSSNDYQDNFTIPNHLSNVRLTDEVKDNIKADYTEKIRSKRAIKKNGVSEYLSSSIKDYQGDKALNEIVTFIQGSSKSNNKSVSSNKTKIYKNPSIKVDECSSIMNTSVVTTDSGLTSDNSSPKSQEMIQSNTDTDSGTQSSQFVSLNNSDEDSSQVIIQDFQEVLSKKQRKTTCLKFDNQNVSLSSANTVCNLKCEIPNKNVINKTKKCAKTQTKMKNSNNSLLHSRESFQHFLFQQYNLFVKKYNTAS